MIKVYIASPYSVGDVARNVGHSFDVANELMFHGFVPYAPLWVHFMHMYYPHPDEVWMTFDLEWLRACDCVLRIPGESKGADREVEIARAEDIPVFYSMNELRKKYGK